MKSLLFLLSALLLGSPATAFGQEVVGVTWDGESGGPVAGATILVRDAAGMEVGHPGAVSDASGRFSLSLDGLTPPMVLLAQRQGYAMSAPFFVEGEAGASVDVLLELRVLPTARAGVTVSEGEGAGDGETARILGWVAERDTGRPILSAEVRELRTGIATTTDANGMFVLDGLPAGETTVGITHISFAPEGHIFRTQPGQSYEIRATMAPDAIPLDGVEVAVRSRTWYRQMDGMRLRMQQGLRGDFLTAAEMEARGFPPVEEAIRQLAGVEIIKTGPFAVDIRFRRCEQQPVLYIDGVQVNQPEDGEPLRELRFLSGIDVEAVEVYRGAASVPPEFSGPDAMCGALVIWTKR